MYIHHYWLHDINLVQGIIQGNQCEERNKIIEIVQKLFPMSYTHLLKCTAYFLLTECYFVFIITGLTAT